MPIENLVFEGGGVRGIAFAGALKRLEELNVTGTIKRIIGSSAGAITAGAVAVGYTGQEMEELLKNTDFNEFKDSSWGVVKDVYRLFSRFGYYKGNVFEEWFCQILTKKCGRGDITFAEVYNQFGIDLIITGTCLSRRKTLYYNKDNTPDMKICKAVRISMSIPGFFQAIFDKNQDEVDVLVDGGTLNNYPINYFDNLKLEHVSSSDKTVGDDGVETFDYSKTLGLKLMGVNELENSQIYEGYEKIDGFESFLSSILSSLLLQIERLHVNDKYWKRTVPIKTFNVDTTEFDITDSMKDKLIQSGYDCTSKFFKKHHNLS